MQIEAGRQAQLFRQFHLMTDIFQNPFYPRFIHIIMFQQDASFIPQIAQNPGELSLIGYRASDCQKSAIQCDGCQQHPCRRLIGLLISAAYGR